MAPWKTMAMRLPADLAPKLVVREGRQLPAVELDRAIEASDVLWQHAHEREGQAALAAAGLADDADRLAAALDGEGDAVDGAHDVAAAGVIPEMEIVDDEQ